MNRVLGCAAAAILMVLFYNLGYLNGRFDLVREPSREAYAIMGWGWDEAEKPADDARMDGATCWHHLDGNGHHCGHRCRPNCYVSDLFRGLKRRDYLF